MIFSVSPLVASCGSNAASPACSGVSCTTRNVSTVITATTTAGRKNFHCHGSATTSDRVMSANTAARPLWIIEPKIAENTPRSETWNQPEFTLIRASAL